MCVFVDCCMAKSYRISNFECNKGFRLYKVTFYFLPGHLLKTAERIKFTPLSVSNLQPRVCWYIFFVKIVVFSKCNAVYSGTKFTYVSAEHYVSKYKEGGILFLHSSKEISTRMYGITSQKTTPFLFTAVRSSDLGYLWSLHGGANCCNEDN